MSLALYAAFIPSPPDGVWNLGPVPLRGYALSIILGTILAIWIGERRWVGRGGTFGDVQDLAIWIVPFGLVGGRLYHVLTDYERFFGEGRNPVTALYTWHGGLGIWGAVALGALGAAIGARRKNIRLLPMLDALASAVLVGQAFGRWGNWFARSSSAGPPTCRGRWRSTRSTGRPASRSSRPSTPRSSTSSSGTSRPSPWSSGRIGGSASATAGWWRST